MQKQSIVSKSVTQTKRFAASLARSLIARADGAVVVGLGGNLGSGKTTFAQGFARGLGIKAKILSPTFVILKKFEIQNSKFKNFYHIDCYRLKNPKELLVLGWEEIISNPKNIVLIEWADRVKKILPKHALQISLANAGKKKRIIDTPARQAPMFQHWGVRARVGSSDEEQPHGILIPWYDTKN